MKRLVGGSWNRQSKDTRIPSDHSNNLTKKKEEQHPRSFQNPLNVQPATDHTIHQNTNSDHATDVTEFITAEKNVK